MFLAVSHQVFEEAQVTKNLCYKLLSCIPAGTTRKKTLELQQKFNVLSEQFENRNPVFTANGYFEINYSLIAVVWTYMVTNLIISLTFKSRT